MVALASRGQSHRDVPVVGSRNGVRPEGMKGLIEGRGSAAGGGGQRQRDDVAGPGCEGQRRGAKMLRREA